MAPPLYFGFGSNLWRDQMMKRCPDSPFQGIARLKGWIWIINDRGYANVVETEGESDEVWGLVYSLSPWDEKKLDRNEGVPFAYTKEMLVVNFWPLDAENEKIVSEVLRPTDETAKKVKMLVYIDRERTTPSKPKEEYIHRMNMGIADALGVGVPTSYVQGVLRKFIPPEGVSEDMKKLAEQQALEFDDDKDPQ